MTSKGKRLWEHTAWVQIRTTRRVDPNKTTMLKPIGKDSSLKTWPGDAWKIGGGSIWVSRL